MKTEISDEILSRLIEASVGTSLRSYVEQDVSVFFRSPQYKTCRLLTDCITLNILLNDNITTHSADEIARYVSHVNRAFYGSVDTTFKSIEQKFITHAKSVIDNYEALIHEDLRTANLVIYVISKYSIKLHNLNRDEVYSKAFTYEELKNISLPKYKN